MCTSFADATCRAQSAWTKDNGNCGMNGRWPTSRVGGLACPKYKVKGVFMCDGFADAVEGMQPLGWTVSVLGFGIYKYVFVCGCRRCSYGSTAYRMESIHRVQWLAFGSGGVPTRSRGFTAVCWSPEGFKTREYTGFVIVVRWEVGVVECGEVD